MPRGDFLILDVFAEQKYAGNQLAVFLDAGGFSSDEMQKLAREMHFSETTFILSDKARDGGYDVRIFTPEAELPFAGHPTLGTGYVIRNETLGGQADRVLLNLKVGQIPVTFEDRLAWMRQRAPELGATCTSSEIAPALALDPSDIDERFPVQVVSTGLPFVIVPLKTLDAVKRSYVVPHPFDAIVHRSGAEGVLVFAPETYHVENQLNVRVYVPEAGVPEDPATGSGNGCLAGYLVRHRYFGNDSIDIRVEQGYELNRPSLLLLRAGSSGDSIEVNVGGGVVPVARGRLI